MNKRFAIAMSAYAILLALASVLLQGLILKATLILLGGLAVKTLIAWRADW